MSHISAACYRQISSLAGAGESSPGEVRDGVPNSVWRRSRAFRSGVFAVLALLCLLAGGCGGRPTHRYTDTKDVKIDTISHVVDGDFLVVTALLVNADDGAVRHSVYRMQWFDETGGLLEQSSWRPVIVKGDSPVYIKERSTMPGAKEYTLVISNDAS